MEKNGQPVEPVELYRRYRPTLFKHIIGQPGALKVLDGFMPGKNLPHAILFSGPSGTGKTTLARILKKKLDCGDTDYQEVNCAQKRGIDTVREIQQRMGLSPWNGSCRIWLFDEAQQLTPEAQSGLLKMLEDTPRHVYFFLCTTEPEKLQRTIHTRCTRIHLRPLSTDELVRVIGRVLEKEGKELSGEVIQKLAEVGEGSAREALVRLQEIIGLESEEDQLKALWLADPHRQAREVAQALLNLQTNWERMATILKEADEGPEDILDVVLGYATDVFLGGGKQADDALRIIQCFGDNYPHGGRKAARRAGLAASCYEVIKQRQTSPI